MSDVEKADGDGSLTGSGINPSSTANPHYPGVGIKYPDVNPRGARKPRKRIRGVNRNGASADANNSVGAFASGGPGGSMGTSKSDDIWSGSAFGTPVCTDMTPKCMDIMCKVCMNKAWEPESLGKRDFSTNARQHLADTGAAMPDGSFPITNATDLANAIRLYGHAKNPDAAKAHIKARARALGLTDSLPDNWK